MANFISKNSLNYEVRKYLEIQDNFREKIVLEKHFPSGSPVNDHSRRFYGANEISFVFEKEWVQFLLSKPGVTHLRAYYGASVDHGREGVPTIILVSAIQHSPTQNTFLNSNDGGVEWPDGLTTSGTSASFDVTNDTV